MLWKNATLGISQGTVRLTLACMWNNWPLVLQVPNISTSKIATCFRCTGTFTGTINKFIAQYEIQYWVCIQATGYANQHILCLSQARINWEDHPEQLISFAFSSIELATTTFPLFLECMPHQLFYPTMPLLLHLLCLPVSQQSRY